MRCCMSSAAAFRSGLSLCWGEGRGFVFGPGVKRCGRRQMECMHLDGQQIGRRARRRQTPKPIHLADDAIVVETGGSLCSSFGWKAGLCTATLALKPRPSPCPSPSSFKAPDEARRSFLLPRSSCSAQCSPVLFYYRDELSWPISLAAANPDPTVTAGLCIKRPDSARRIATTRRPRSLDRLPRSLPAYLRVYLPTYLPTYTLYPNTPRPSPATCSFVRHLFLTFTMASKVGARPSPAPPAPLLTHASFSENTSWW